MPIIYIQWETRGPFFDFEDRCDHATPISPHPLLTRVTLLHHAHLQRTDLERSRPCGDGVISDGGVAARQHNVRLARDRRRAVGCGWNGQSEASINGGRAAEFD